MAAARGRCAGVVLAGGAGTRVGASRNKVYLPLAGRRVISWSLAAFRRSPEIGRLVLVVRAEDRELAEHVLARELPGTAAELVEGGRTRHESEQRALEHLAPDIRAGGIDVVAIHDGARPLLAPRLLAAVVTEARACGGALPALAVHDVATMNGSLEVRRAGTEGGLVRVQTPQAFRARPLLEAYQRAAGAGFTGSDTSSCIERFSKLTVRCIEGDPRNLKVTHPQDMFIAERLLAAAHYEVR